MQLYPFCWCEALLEALRCQRTITQLSGALPSCSCILFVGARPCWKHSDAREQSLNSVVRFPHAVVSFLLVRGPAGSTPMPENNHSTQWCASLMQLYPFCWCEALLEALRCQRTITQLSG